MMLELLVAGFWIALGTYLLWFFFKANTVHPLTIDDLALTWRLHKQQSGCKSTQIHGLIKKNDEIVGFECECGYKFIQKRLITQRSQEQAVRSPKEAKQKQDDELMSKAASFYG